MSADFNPLKVLQKRPTQYVLYAFSFHIFLYHILFTEWKISLQVCCFFFQPHKSVNQPTVPTVPLHKERSALSGERLESASDRRLQLPPLTESGERRLRLRLPLGLGFVVAWIAESESKAKSQIQLAAQTRLVQFAVSQKSDESACGFSSAVFPPKLRRPVYYYLYFYYIFFLLFFLSTCERFARPELECFVFEQCISAFCWRVLQLSHVIVLAVTPQKAAKKKRKKNVDTRYKSISNTCVTLS